MEELTLQTMIAVFEEMFGAGLFWAMVATAVIITLAYVYVLIRDKRVGMRKFLIAQLFMPLGAVAAVWFVMVMTDSALSDIGGPVDVIVLLASRPWARWVSPSSSTRWRRWPSAGPPKISGTVRNRATVWASRRSDRLWHWGKIIP